MAGGSAPFIKISLNGRVNLGERVPARAESEHLSLSAALAAARKVTLCRQELAADSWTVLPERDGEGDTHHERPLSAVNRKFLPHPLEPGVTLCRPLFCRFLLSLSQLPPQEDVPCVFCSFISAVCASTCLAFISFNYLCLLVNLPRQMGCFSLNPQAFLKYPSV